VRNDSKKGHILEVDLEYPEELHDLHNEYPYCPEQVVVKSEMLSDYAKVIAQRKEINVTILLLN
jgi:hypothetical protein